MEARILARHIVLRSTDSSFPFQLREADGKRPSQSLFDKMACVCSVLSLPSHRIERVPIFSETNLHAMRLGPGKHLHGLTLMGGAVTPEEFDYFHEVRSLSSIARIP